MRGFPDVRWVCSRWGVRRTAGAAALLAGGTGIAPMVNLSHVILKNNDDKVKVCGALRLLPAHHAHVLAPHPCCQPACGMSPGGGARPLG